MSQHYRNWNKGVYERYIREGRGSGWGPDYTPWIRIQDFASRGIVSRVKGRTTGRVHHLMSNNELAYFYILDWSEEVTDIREQYPLLDIDCAVNIAAQAGIKYPVDNVSGFPYVLTCDFMVTTLNGLKARTIKMMEELKNIRTLEKLEIERRYWLTQGIEWKVVTEREILYKKAKNIEWLYTAYEDDPNIYELSNAKDTMIQMIHNGHSIVDTAQIVESKFLLSAGIGLRLFKQLVLNRKLTLDLNGTIDLYSEGVATKV